MGAFFDFIINSSFVRSVTMDKWKDEELERMKVGGNAAAIAFLEGQPDFRPDWSFEEKYHSKAAGEPFTHIVTDHPAKLFSETRLRRKLGARVGLWQRRLPRTTFQSVCRPP